MNLNHKTKEELEKLAETIQVLKEKHKTRLLDFAFPSTGAFRRELYAKALEFFSAGKDHQFRMLGGANGTGKSYNGTIELVYHITGLYPEWWTGKVQEAPKLWWIVSESPDMFKSCLQRLLLGSSLNDEDMGTGLIPKELIINTGAWSGVSGCVRNIEVRHKKGHIVTIEIKSFDQERSKLQGANIDGVLFDEEPPLDVYTECIFRLRGSPIKPPGISLLLFTPLKGLTDVVLSYLKDGKYPSKGQHPDDPDKYVVRIEMDEVPHLSLQDKRMYLANCPPNQLEARTKGFPAMGSGKIYPYPESQVFVAPFAIPDYWPRTYALDFGHHVTCAIWAAKDPHSNTLYIYDEYYCEHHETAQIHALNVQAKGAWIKGICDPSGGGRQDDGRQLMEIFQSYGLDLIPGENAFMPGITRNCNMFQNGTLKIFDHLDKIKVEYRLYRFDTKNPNEPARNQKDHAMDCMKYLTSMFDYASTSKSAHEHPQDESPRRNEFGSRDKLTGY